MCCSICRKYLAPIYTKVKLNIKCHKICFTFLLSDKFTAPLKVSTCALLPNGGARSAQRELLHVEDFQEWRAGTSDAQRGI